MKKRFFLCITALTCISIYGYAPGGELEKRAKLEKRAYIQELNKLAPLILASLIMLPRSQPEMTHLLHVFIKGIQDFGRKYVGSTQIDDILPVLPTDAPLLYVILSREEVRNQWRQIADPGIIPPEEPPFSREEPLDIAQQPPQAPSQTESAEGSLYLNKPVLIAWTAMVVALIQSYSTIKNYVELKNQLVKKYELKELTPLQNKVWMATKLASYGISWPLRFLVKRNPENLEQLVGNKWAVAELYYGYVPTEYQLFKFLLNYFPHLLNQ